jgi:hypothetical protein
MKVNSSSVRQKQKVSMCLQLGKQLYKAASHPALDPDSSIKT